MTDTHKNISVGDIINNVKDILQKPIEFLKNFIDMFENRAFGPIFRKYLKKEWPIISSVSKDEKNNTLNTGFPDFSCVYYIASFEKKNKVELDGEVPDNILFLSLSLYNNMGEVIYSVDDKNLYQNTNQNTKKNNYKVKIEDNKISYNEISKDIGEKLSDTYCIIYRLYKNVDTTTNDLNFIPKINIKDEVIVGVNDESRMKDSNKLQDLIYRLSKNKFKKIIPTNTVDMNESLKNYFLKININEFFLPAQSQLSLVFPNHYSDYLIAFPNESRVMKITGKLPEKIGMNQKIRYLGFMTGNFITTATDDCISYEDLKNKFSIYVSFTKEDAGKYGYKDTEDKLILWKKENNCPVVVFRILFQDKDVMFPSIDNKRKIYAGTQLKKLNIKYYPNVECFPIKK